MTFQDKVVVITGAASGIGQATAVRFAAQGAVVALGDINEEGLLATRALLGEDARVSLHRVDVGDPADCEAFIAAAAKAHGRIDILANVAGVLDWSPLGDFDAARWNRLVSINMGGVFFLSQAAAAHLKATQGNIVNVASAAALVGIAYNSAYCASKAGVVAMTKAMAIELAGDQVRVNAVCPSGVMTPMIMAAGLPEGADMNLIGRAAPKLGRLIEADEVAASILFLASNDGRSITGSILAVDSAQTAG
ncbi:MAG: SDR family NAD(P)-dependent oxidoreductase [Candidatus Brevundimonas phytovorans]|nr:SDR family oxidoreductase [Brevundimonas sp.]WEK56780.1 MAG: SDR family NAD(P)-dependent oxidoreductase [Brevundimonas sp.]